MIYSSTRWILLRTREVAKDNVATASATQRVVRVSPGSFQKPSGTVGQ